MSAPTDPIRFSIPERPKGDTRKKLGKGLEALMGQSRREEPLVVSGDESGASGAGDKPRPDEGLAAIAIARIEPLPGQPRRRFDEAALEELAASIAQRGVIQPIIVTPLGGDRYRLVAGERRWRAAQRAKLHEIPAIVRDLSEREVMALALIENLQREDLNPVEEGRAYQQLADSEGMTQAEIARLVDKSRSHVANLQRLLQLPESVLDMVERDDLSMGHARALIGNPDAAALADRAVAEGLSVRDVERLARRAGEGESTRRKPRVARDSAGDADIVAVQRHLEELLGLHVRIKTDADPRSGEVTIRYRTLDQLDLVCQRLTGGDI
ncbi:ParB/RepB/Spo0J family partition protein [Altererythrobacter aerius]|uniref:ParB/RepB/Spo0J family partition protein n=1 Tax=Tsuneonella aeria TaxID=1837929 RepID=A0A6I4TFR6_9SPHN|nr:ParB/RepB/Spo0J family partition protein [Tsuneonella aeria]MXO75437.1 ParB/RepB/Spo0J family partition protein [Tsuneonella aeria]